MHSKTSTLQSRPSQRVNTRLLCIFTENKQQNGLTGTMNESSECWWTVPQGVPKNRDMTWPETDCTKRKKLCQQQVQGSALLLFSCTFSYSPQSKLQGLVQLLELNKTAVEGLLVICREVVTTPETSKSTDKSLHCPGNRLIWAISPSEPLETQMAGNKETTAFEVGLHRLQERMHRADAKTLIGTDLQLMLQRLSPLPMQIVEVHILFCPIVLL